MRIESDLDGEKGGAATRPETPDEALAASSRGAPPDNSAKGGGAGHSLRDEPPSSLPEVAARTPPDSAAKIAAEMRGHATPATPGETDFDTGVTPALLEWWAARVEALGERTFPSEWGVKP